MEEDTTDTQNLTNWPNSLNDIIYQHIEGYRILTKTRLYIVKCADCDREIIATRRRPPREERLCIRCGWIEYEKSGKIPEPEELTEAEIERETGWHEGIIEILLALRAMTRERGIRSFKEFATLIDDFSVGYRTYPLSWYREVDEERTKGEKAEAAIAGVARKHGVPMPKPGKSFPFRTQYYDHKKKEREAQEKSRGLDSIVKRS